MCNEIDGIIEAYAEKFGNFNVLLTGGDAPYFVHHLKNKIFADPDLIFKGLYAISEYNDDTKTVNCLVLCYLHFRLFCFHRKILLIPVMELVTLYPQVIF